MTHFSFFIIMKCLAISSYTANISNPSATRVQFIAAIFATFSCCNQMVAIGTTIWLQIKSAISSCKIYIYWLLQLIVAKFKENLI